MLKIKRTKPTNKEFMKNYILLIIGFVISTGVYAQGEWIVPADKKGKLSTVTFSSSMEKLGADIFKNNCVSCHGTPGQNNPIPLMPSPGDPAGSKFSDNTDGELYYKIQEGRVTMPSFKSALSATDTWNVIAYIRSFHKGYKQEVAAKVETNIPEGATLAMDLSYDADAKKVLVKVIANNEGKQIPVAGVDVKIVAKRYFGQLPIGEPKTTDGNGIANIDWNDELPGDSIGNVALTASFVDTENYGDLTVAKDLKIAVATNKPALNAERAMWNTVKKAPLWILFSYLGGVITVWFFIIYVALSLKKIFALGKDEVSEEEQVIY